MLGQDIKVHRCGKVFVAYFLNSFKFEIPVYSLWLERKQAGQRSARRLCRWGRQLTAAEWLVCRLCAVGFFLWRGPYTDATPPCS